jgi:hypothetical protein
LQARTIWPSSTTAGTAQALAATIFGAGQFQVGAQHPQQSALIVGIQRGGPTIQGELDLALHVASLKRGPATGMGHGCPLWR